MTDAEINIAIAEACGWSDIRELDDLYPDGSVAAGVWWQGVPPDSSDLEGDQIIPDYCLDLNAMHEAEDEIFERDLGQEYRDTLDKLTNCDPYCPSAKTRAEAFLRTLGRWRGDA